MSKLTPEEMQNLCERIPETIFLRADNHVKNGMEIEPALMVAFQEEEDFALEIMGLKSFPTRREAIDRVKQQMCKEVYHLQHFAV